MHNSQLLKILGETADDLKNRGTKIPKELLELYVYCEKYSAADKFKIKDFNQLFERCMTSLNKLAEGGYLGLNNPNEKEELVVKLDDLKKEIESEQAVESETDQLFKRLYRSYVLVYLSLLELRRNPLHDEALKLPINLSPSILAIEVHQIASDFPQRLESYKKYGDKREEEFLSFLLSGGQGSIITQIFRLQRFILDYCSRKELIRYPICRSFLNDGRHFCRAVSELFKTFKLMGVEFHVGIRFFEKPPSINYEDAMSFGLPVFSAFEPDRAKQVLYKIASSNWNKYNGTVADLSFLGCKSDKFENLDSKTRLYCWYG